MKQYTAEEIYHKLVDEEKILAVRGQIRFDLAQVSIVVKQKDVVGNIIHEWLAGWLSSHSIPYKIGENSQMPPDFYLSPEDPTKNLLEVKAFNRKATPGFDIADFKAYQRELLDKPYMLHVNYLIFGYEMDQDGFVVIKDLWLKKVWEITRRMSNWPLNLQIKQGVVHKIRPCVWYSHGGSTFTPFRCIEDFVSAIDETIHNNPDTRSVSGTWLSKFRKSYQEHYGDILDIPRWHDIEESYLKAEK